MAEAKHCKVLVVDDERDICRALEFLLSGDGYLVKTASSGEEALELVKKEVFDVVLTDLKMGAVDGIEVLRQTRKLSPETSVIMMTAYGSVETAVEAMKAGALDYIVKPFINEEIRHTVRRAIERMTLRSENLALRQELGRHRKRCKEFVFESPAMGRVFETIEDVTPTRSNVLLLGESGTGKGLVAEIMHCGSPRGEGPFISINCAAIPETLLESELFGYKKGAFTGAASDKKGLIMMAHGGTLFLDEIGDMPPALQAKLLKVLDTGDVTPLGDTRPVHSDIRLLSATNRDLEARVSEGLFREDLYYRINVLEIKIPPLRERREDIPLLALVFLEKLARAEGPESIDATPREITQEALDALTAYGWPGNVRELSNAIERALVVSKGKAIGLLDLPEKIRSAHQKQEGGAAAGLLKEKLLIYEKQVIVQAYEENKRSKEATASALGMDLATLYRKMKKLGIEG